MMMKKISSLLLIMMITSTLCFAQSPSETIHKKWQLNELVEFGEKYALNDTQKDDWLEFDSNHQYAGTINGESIVGSWAEKNNKIVMTKGSDSKFKVNWIKVISLENENLVITYQSTDLIKSTFFYIPAEE